MSNFRECVRHVGSQFGIACVNGTAALTGEGSTVFLEVLRY